MRLAELLETPLLSSAPMFATGRPDAQVRTVQLAETADAVSQAEPGSVLILTRTAASAVRSYRLDVLMARAKHAGV